MSALPPFLINLQQQLTEKQTKQAAWKIIDEYFGFFEQEDIHNELWMLTVAALTNEEMDMKKSKDRHNTIFFLEYTKMFYEAVHLLHNKNKKKRNKQSP